MVSYWFTQIARGLIVGYTFDNANHLKQVTQGSATAAFLYDGDGRRTSTTLPNGVNMAYGYDAASQLTGITYTLASGATGTLTYAYDSAGRRTGVGGTFARTGVPQAASSATYNVNNQLTNWKGATLTYDLNGNLTSDGTNAYTWNARNQLVSISGGVSASFQYDAFGRRVSKTIGGTTQFLYDGANPVQEISGGSASANLLTGGVDEYFQRTDSTGASGFITDALGSTVALTDSTGTVQTTSYTFEPFGNTTVTGSATTNSFAYTGRELDFSGSSPAGGLYYYGFRYYNPTLQRFVSEDPIGFVGGTNVYSYAGNSPAEFIDPFGLDKKKKGFDRCLKENAHNYSLVGFVDLVTGSIAPYLDLEGTDLSESVLGNVVGGNDVTGIALLLVGDPENAPEAIGAVATKGTEIGLIGGYGFAGGIGQPLLVGGQVTGGPYIQNFLGWSKTGKLYAGGPGRPAQALLRSGNLTKAVKLAKAAAELKAAIDLGLAGALAIDCALGVI